MKFLRGVSNFADGVPVVGHVKGGIHYACGDKDGGDTAMKAASRTVGVLGGGVVGGLTLGPVGAVAGGIAGGATLDGITTAVDSAVHDEYRPAGQVAAVGNIINGDATVGDIFDSAVGVTFDGFAGYSAGEAAIRFRNARNNVKLHRVAGEAEIENSVKAGKLMKKMGKNGEAWMSEGMEHTKAYYDSWTFADKGIMEIEVPREALRDFKADMIKQKGSKIVQKAHLDAGQGRANLFNTERLQKAPQGKVNLGIKGKANLQAFNERIVGIRKISPDHQGPVKAPGLEGVIKPAHHHKDSDEKIKQS